MKRFILLPVLTTLFVTLVATHPASASGESFVNDYRACARFLKMTPQQQRAVFIPGRLSFNGLIASCRAVVRRGLKSAAAKDRAGSHSRRRSRDDDPAPAPNYHDECSGAPGSINCTNHGPGSIYDRAGCNQSPASINCQ